jgi:CheY-like chemotaxis protein
VSYLVDSDRSLVPEAAPSQRADDATLEAAMFGDVELAPREHPTVIDPALTFYVLDDEPAVARAVTRRLQRFGYTVIGTAHEPTQALREILELRPRLAILDINLNAVLDGVDVATHLRAAGFDAPIVFFTGETQPNLSALRDTEGVFAYVAKAELSDNFRTTLDLVMTQDATRRRLREVDHRHRLLFEQAAVGVAELDVVAGQLITANQRCAALLKRSCSSRARSSTRGASWRGRATKRSRSRCRAGPATARRCTCGSTPPRCARPGDRRAGW